MKKVFFTFVLCAATLFASCYMGSGVYFAPLPSGVYVAGRCNNGDIRQACYWADNERTVLDRECSQADYITVVEGRVLVTGNLLTMYTDDDGSVRYYVEEDSYRIWVDGERYDRESYNWENAVNNNGKRYTVGGGSYWVDGERVEFDYYWVDGEWVKADHFWVSAITVDAEGTLYVLGYGDIGHGYFVNGIFYEYQRSEYVKGLYVFYPNRITVTGGRVYVFGWGIGDRGSIRNVYWVDGEEVVVNMPEGVYIEYITAANGKLYMAGYYWRGEVPQACWWVDGARHDLDGSVAMAIHVEG
jgi:hypothetical protein